MITKDGNGSVVHIATVFNPFRMLPVKGSFETGLFAHISNYVFPSAYFREKISYEGHVFFQNVQKLMCISKIEKKI